VALAGVLAAQLPSTTIEQVAVLGFRVAFVDWRVLLLAASAC